MIYAATHVHRVTAVEAHQWDGEEQSALLLIAWLHEMGLDARYVDHWYGTPPLIAVAQGVSEVNVREHDYLVVGNGGFWVMSQADFERSYSHIAEKPHVDWPQR